MRATVNKLKSNMEETHEQKETKSYKSVVRLLADAPKDLNLESGNYKFRIWKNDGEFRKKVPDINKIVVVLIIIALCLLGNVLVSAR